ncbi:MAG TPA: 6-phosphogluconolactonase [Bryobacteraceae bacterium]|nr:6-phosphogluconolactonase [Bryobacteraceae bacterium]
MKVEVLPTTESVADRAAAFVAEQARRAVAERKRFVFGASGGRTPWLMLRTLSTVDLPWPQVHIVQVDERVAPAGHADRNVERIRESLLDQAPIPVDQIHAMPVECHDLVAAAAKYGASLRAIAGSPPTLDVVQLGLGRDGHTASLLPGDAALAIEDSDVAMTGFYDGRCRMSLTYPMINRSRVILWIVTGAEKAEMLGRLLNGDQSIPAGRIRRHNSLVIADEAAAGALPLRSGTQDDLSETLVRSTSDHRLSVHYR